jgi:hypothetical protein
MLIAFGTSDARTSVLHMAAFSFKAIDAHIGPWHWDGFAAPTGSPLASARRLGVEGGRSWDFWQPLDEDWQRVIGAVEEIARAGVQGGQLAWRQADGALRSALSRRYRDFPVPGTSELREVARSPRCRVQLHGVRIEFDAGAGAMVRASGAPRTVRIQTDLPPQVIMAARYAHRYAFQLAEAAMLDMAAQVGDHVPSFEQALDRLEDVAASA